LLHGDIEYDCVKCELQIRIRRIYAEKKTVGGEEEREEEEM
jgi:hypothetical protein